MTALSSAVLNPGELQMAFVAIFISAKKYKFFFLLIKKSLECLEIKEYAEVFCEVFARASVETLTFF